MGSTPLCGTSTPIMSSVTSRAAGAIVGSFIADAACLPVHWMYDQDELAAAVSKYPTPEFIPEPAGPFYRLPTGKNSTYGDHLFTLLKSVVDSNGFDREAYQKGLKAMFGSGSAYDYERSGRPVLGPWLPGTMKKFLANYEAGKENTGDTGSSDCDGVDNTVVMAALYGGTPELMSKVEDMVKVVQNNPLCLKYSAAAAKLLESYIVNGADPNALEKIKPSVEAEVAQGIEKVFGEKNKPHKQASKEFGYACSLPGNFLSALHCLANADAQKFTESVRPTLLAGGDNCSRAIFIGGCLGAQLGLEGLPLDLLSKVERGSEVKALAEKLVAMR
ncbi:crystallin J1A-like [Diadema antillarum]|uniref:crystallin J1A-like n=1 Tax=Diadema antillarum TaxID=105358 RepID=UPI003A8C0A3E